MSTYRHNRNVMKNDKEVGGSSISQNYESANPLNPESLFTQSSYKLINQINGALIRGLILLLNVISLYKKYHILLLQT